MATKELRKMKRMELLDIIFALQENEEKLRNEKETLEAKLQERTIIMENAGSIAEAVMPLNEVFFSAQAAADQYLESIRALEENAKKQAEEIIAEAKSQAEEIIAEAKKQVEREKFS